MKKKLFTAILCILMAMILYACSGGTVDTSGGGDEDSGIGDTEQSDTAFSFFEDYIESPKVALDIYEEPLEIKGLYISAARAGGTASDGTKYIDNYIRIANETEINAFVIDIKDERGNITFKNKLSRYDDMDLSVNYIPRVDEFMEKLYENDIYPIARIVAFKDNAMPETRPDLMVLNEDGSIYRDNSNNAWLNPYIKENWEIALEVAKCAALLGFKEIQFDYIRFVADPKLSEENFGNTDGKLKEEIILEFIQYAVDELRPLGVKVSADVYGTVITSGIDAKIVGQNYVEMSKILDVICPMVYPSHYSGGYFNVQNPDMEPYKMVYESIAASNQKLAEIGENEHRAIVRPWLQSFTASYLRTGYQVYGAAQINEQINAVYDAGETEWLLWNPSSNYPEDMLDRIN